jgi:hypothetical protein
MAIYGGFIFLKFTCPQLSYGDSTTLTPQFGPLLNFSVSDGDLPSRSKVAARFY